MSQAQRPVHVGLILDGNRRWAKANGLPTMEGHRKGYANLKTIAKHFIKEHGVKYLSAYIFSTENWQRSKDEVKYLMDLTLWVAKNEIKELHKEGFRAVFLGSRNKLSAKVQKAIVEAEELTKNNTGGTLALCFNYGGQEEIAHAVRGIVRAGIQAANITPQLIEKFLYGPGLPPVDLVIRTSGEQRTSGFMLWRAAYAELFFVDKFWPDFTTADADRILADYAARERRFGK